MKCSVSFLLWLFLSSAVFPAFATVSTCRAQMPVPSKWEGEMTGQVYNTPFKIPVTVEVKASLADEKNPFHLFIGADDDAQVGHILLSSASRFSTTKGPVLLQYLAISIQGNHLTAILSDNHGAEAAKLNGFTGPNVSAEQASNLMRDIYRTTFGDTELFAFKKGATVQADLLQNQLVGTIEGNGSSYTATSSGVHYQAQFRVVRTE